MSGQIAYHNKESKEIYEGKWQNGKKHGRGVLKLMKNEPSALTLMNNAIVETKGLWSNNELIFATIKYKNGDTYFGKLKANKKNGKGIYTRKG